MRPFAVQRGEDTTDGLAAVLRPTNSSANSSHFPREPYCSISMFHKFCSRMQAAGLKLTLTEKPRPRPTAVRNLRGPERNTRACCPADLSAFRDHRSDRQHQGKANSSKENIVGLGFFFPFFLSFSLQSSKNKNSVSGGLFLVVTERC